MHIWLNTVILDFASSDAEGTLKLTIVIASSAGIVQKCRTGMLPPDPNKLFFREVNFRPFSD